MCTGACQKPVCVCISAALISAHSSHDAHTHIAQTNIQFRIQANAKKTTKNNFHIIPAFAGPYFHSTEKCVNWMGEATMHECEMCALFQYWFQIEHETFTDARLIPQWHYHSGSELNYENQLHISIAAGFFSFPQSGAPKCKTRQTTTKIQILGKMKQATAIGSTQKYNRIEKVIRRAAYLHLFRSVLSISVITIVQTVRLAFPARDHICMAMSIVW